MPEKRYYLTKQGLQKIEQELDTLKSKKQDLLNGTGPRAFRFGEIEAEYIAFREDLRRVEEKIFELENVLENYGLIEEPAKKERDKVHLGAKVLVEIDGQLDEFLIVGTLEADPAMGKISNESPVGKALIGRKAGEQIIINSPTNIKYTIKKIRY